MKRSAELQPLARDRYRALYVALRLRRAGAEGAAEAAEGFREFWREQGERLFEIEERCTCRALRAAAATPATHWSLASSRITWRSAPEPGASIDVPRPRSYVASASASRRTSGSRRTSSSG